MPRPSELPDASGLRLALFTDTYTPQVNGVARTLERLVGAVESMGVGGLMGAAALRQQSLVNAGHKAADS